MSEKTVATTPSPLNSPKAKKENGLVFHIKDYLHHLSLFSREARLFLAGTFFAAYTFAVYQLLLNLYLKELGFKEGFIGSILSATALGTLLTAMPLVIVMRRVPYRRILIGSMLCAALGYGTLALVVDKTAIWLAALFSGASASGLRLVAPPLFMQISSPQERTYLFSLNFGTWIFAAIVGNLSGGYLVKILENLGQSQVSSLRWALLASVVMGLISTIPFYRILARPAKKEASSDIWKMENLKKRGKLYFKLGFPLFMVGMGAGLIIPFLNLYFRDLFKQSPHQIGIYFAWLQLFMLAGILTGPVLAKKLGMIRTIVFTELASIPFMLILAF